MIGDQFQTRGRTIAAVPHPGSRCCFSCEKPRHPDSRSQRAGLTGSGEGRGRVTEIERVPLTRINPAPYNPRKALKPGDPEYQSISRSLDTFGLVEPLVWNRRTGNLVGGHQRLRVLRDQGVNEVEVSVVDVDQDQERLLNLALNRISGQWDEQMLAMVLRGLREDGQDLTLAGFGEQELDGLLARLEPEPEPHFSDAAKGAEPKMLVSFVLARGAYDGLLAEIERCSDLLGVPARIQEIEA